LGRVKVVIKADHTFTQAVRTNNEAARTLNGKWEFKDGSLLLTPCLSVTHDSQGVDADACSSVVEVIGFGRAEISLDPDFGIAYRK
jgi:ABC-type uncharacterized transport system YnjBCD ATPase subunit